MDEDVFRKTIQIATDETLFEFMRKSEDAGHRDHVKLLCSADWKEAHVLVNINIGQDIANYDVSGLRQIVVGVKTELNDIYIGGKRIKASSLKNSKQRRVYFSSVESSGFEFDVSVYYVGAGYRFFTPLKFFVLNTRILNILDYVLFHGDGDTDAYKKTFGGLAKYGDLLAFYGRLWVLRELLRNTSLYSEQDFQKSKILRLLKDSSFDYDFGQLCTLLDNVVRRLDTEVLDAGGLIIEHARRLGKQDLSRCITGWVIESLPSFEV